MRIHCFQHVHFEGPGIICEWAKEKGHIINYTRFYDKIVWPEMNDFDFLIVMGGPMSFDDDDLYSWMKKEREIIGQAIANNKTVLGICLGAQFIAHAIDGSGRRGHSQEIGWFPLSFSTDFNSELSFFPSELKAFHWHGDTFDIPKGAFRIASTNEYPNQGFLLKDNVIGLQFHLEVDVSALEGMVKYCGDGLKVDKFVQNSEQILSDKTNLEENQNIMFKLLNYLESKTNIN